MARVNAALIVLGALCLVLMAALVDPRLGLGILGILLIAAGMERP